MKARWMRHNAFLIRGKRQGVCVCVREGGENILGDLCELENRTDSDLERAPPSSRNDAGVALWQECNPPASVRGFEDSHVCLDESGLNLK